MTSRRVILVAAVITVALVGAGATFTYLDWPTPQRPTAAGPALVTAQAEPFEPLSPDAPVPTTNGLAAALAPTLTNPDLGLLTGKITDALTGTELWSQGSELPQTPGSVAKLLTAAAALLALSPAHRLSTTVVRGDTPGDIVLVGGGDPTLTAEPAGADGYYTDAPRMDDLVEQVRASGIPVRRVVVDTSLFPGPDMAVGWNPIDIGGGSITPIQSLMLDGGRLSPLIDYSPRTSTPALDAGRVLADRLGVDPAAVTLGAAPPTAEPVATVWSASLRVRLHQMMVASDDVTAETIGLEVARARGKPETFSGSVAAVSEVLGDAGFDLTGLALADVSGLSTADRIPARMLDDILTATTDSDARAARLRPLLDDLAVGGGSGTLSDRFVTPSPAAGWVRAKTGTLDFVNALAGIVTDVDGRALTFTFMSTGTMADVAKPALDAVATTLRQCGCR